MQRAGSSLLRERRARVDALLRMRRHRLNAALVEEQLDALAREARVEPQPVRQDARGDHLVLRHLRHELVIRDLALL